MMNSTKGLRSEAMIHSEKVTILSDLDGVLLDSWPGLKDTYVRLCLELEVAPLFEEFRNLVGKDLESIFKALHSDLPLAKTCSRFRSLSQDSPIEMRPFRGAQPFIASLLELTPNVAYLTSKDEGRARKALEGLGFPRLPIFSPTKTLRAKPAPDLFIAAGALFGRGRQLYFGDTSWDQKAARSASAEFIFCDWGYGSPDMAAPPITKSDFESALAAASSFAKA